MVVIDAHQHCWDPGKVPYPWLGPQLSPINRPIAFDELIPVLAAHGIDRTVLVQSADNDADTDYMLGVAGEHPEVAAVVAWAPLDRPTELAGRLAWLGDREVVVGIRNLIHDLPDPDWLSRPEVRQGLEMVDHAGMTFDVVSVVPRHLEQVPVLAAQHPELRLVIDHLSKPPIKSDHWEPWKGLIARAARHPNVYAKVSGLYPVSGGRADWTASDLKPFVDYALELFGASRLMYGGDWPISVLYGGYDAVWGELGEIFAELSEAERAAILGGTAAEVYRIPAGRLPPDMAATNAPTVP
jgi:L-fuconolactonase